MSEGAERVIEPVLGDDWPATGDGDPALLIAQIPHARELPPGTRVVVLEEGTMGRPGLFGRVIGRRPKRASRAARGTALLAQGYERIESARDEASGVDRVWGYA